MVVYARWTHVRLAFKRERTTCQTNIISKQTCDRRKRKQMWIGGEIRGMC